MKVELVGPIGDFSGYGHDCRQTAHSLLKAGVDLSITRIIVDQSSTTCDFGRIESVLRPYIRKAEEPDVQILHAPPQCWAKHVRGDCLTIGKTAWETDAISHDWVKFIRNAGIQELWVPSDFNVNVFKESLPTLSVMTIPHAHDVDAYTPGVEPLDLSPFGVSADTFVFGSGFQWTARKNPEGLIAAYLAEFDADEPVALVLKTHTWDTTEKATGELYQKLIDIIKETGFNRPRGKIALLPQTLPFDMMLQWHKRVNCGVYPHRGEGWGLHISESMLMETPCIVTNWSGSTEYCDDSNSYLLDYQLQPVRGMSWCPWYDASQSWAEPNLVQLRKLMRAAFEGRESSELQDKGIAARSTIYDNYNLYSVARLMKDRLEALVG
jgi:glycosyltransferase involved in cell wall biosynthesis